MKSILIVSLAIAFCCGCGGPAVKDDAVSNRPKEDLRSDFPLKISCKLPRKGAQAEGDTVYLRVLGDIDYKADVFYAAGADEWKLIKKGQAPRQGTHKETGASIYLLQVVWRFPDITSSQFSFKIAARTADGKVSEIIKPLDVIIDSYIPESKITFDPFSL